MLVAQWRMVSLEIMYKQTTKFIQQGVFIYIFPYTYIHMCMHVYNNYNKTKEVINLKLGAIKVVRRRVSGRDWMEGKDGGK